MSHPTGRIIVVALLQAKSYFCCPPPHRKKVLVARSREKVRDRLRALQLWGFAYLLVCVLASHSRPREAYANSPLAFV